MTSLPDRIDFTTLSDGRVIVLKLRRDTTDPAVPRDIPVADSDVKPAGFDLDAALAWCAAHGYAIRRWPASTHMPGGARAWQAPAPWIIRTRNMIQRLRDRYPCAQLDFAYDG